MSAICDGSVRLRSASHPRRCRCSRMLSTTALYPPASCSARSVGSGSSTISASTPARPLGHPGPDDRPAAVPGPRRPHPAGQLAGVLQVNERPDAGVVTLDAGHEQQATVGGRIDRGPGFIGLGGEGEDHPGQHHAAREWQHGGGSAW